MLPSREEMYQALLQRDSQYEGTFIAAIKTTGIFCRPTCRARKPKPENVDYYATVKEALAYGYRACKICHPLQSICHYPNWLSPLMAELDSNPAQRINDSELRHRGYQPERIRRWFNKHLGMTFQAYLRSNRINAALGLIRYQQPVIDAAMATGYESTSGFHHTYKRLTGFSPNRSSEQPMITLTRLDTPLGPMFAATTDEGLCLLEFTDRRMLETQFDRLKRYVGEPLLTGQHPLFKELNQQLTAYFAGELQHFSIPLDMRGTAFQQQVWQQLLSIPYGQTKSYQQQAEALGNPAAVRAVARANGDNRIAIIIPCHRVIGKNGQLTGYGGGIWRKQKLLEIEQQRR